jgi:hypothetical protein
MDGTEDYKVITSDEGQTAYARAVSEGLIEYLGLQKKPVVNSTPVSSNGIKEGDMVAIIPYAKYYDGSDIPAWVINKRWYVDSVDGDRVVVNKSLDGKNSINSPVNAKYLIKVNDANEVIVLPGTAVPYTAVPYMVKVDIANLNIRTGPGTNYSATGRYTGRGVFTITDFKNGPGANKGWGKLKSGAGWISLDFVTKV